MLKELHTRLVVVFSTLKSWIVCMEDVIKHMKMSVTPEVHISIDIFLIFTCYLEGKSAIY